MGHPCPCGILLLQTLSSALTEYCQKQVLPTKFLHDSSCSFVIKSISKNKHKGVADLLENFCKTLLLYGSLARTLAMENKAAHQLASQFLIGGTPIVEIISILVA